MADYNWNERHIITFPNEELALTTKDLHVYYGENEAIKGIDMQFEKNKITALIGPSGCGKSTFLRSLNRMNDTIDIAKVTGEILYEGIDVNAPNINVYEMRKHIGMVFQRPNPFAKSIYDNITFAHERAGVKDKKTLDEIVETSLRQAALWDQVKDDLHKSALPCLEDSSSGFVSPERFLSNQIFCLWTNRLPHLTPLQQCSWKKPC